VPQPPAQQPLSSQGLRAKLAAEVDRVPWPELKSHARADRLFVVAAHLDLLEVAVAVATDSATQVESWIGRAELARPEREELDAWGAQARLEFRCVIVQPFVLVQPLAGESPASD